MTGRDDLFLCAGFSGAELHRGVLEGHGLNLEVQHFVSAESVENELERRIKQVFELKESTGLRVAFHAPFKQVNYFSRNTERVRRSEAVLSASLEAAARLGAEFVVMHSLYVPRRRNAAYGSDWHRCAPSFFRRFIGEAARLGLPVAIENMLETGPESLLRLIDEIGMPQTSVCLDVAHTAIAGGASPAEWVRGLGGALRHVHLSDNRGVHDDHLVLGEGIVDLAGTLEAVKGTPGEVTLGIECRLWPAENLARSLAFLAPFLEG